MPRQTRIKGLQYKAARRSTLEMDLLLRRVSERLDWDGLSDQELDALDHILDLEDLDLLPALKSMAEPPPGADRAMWKRILSAL